ncbi:MAG TPA: hypothetical protein VLY04_19810 [Bryobacteraceae bacterium]|nr:hypothetical protein [Bryobacteraceae bacterium]
MARPNTFWLTLTNIVLACLVVVCLLVVAVGVLCESRSKLERRQTSERELNHDMEEMFGTPHPAVAALPGDRLKLSHWLVELICRFWRRIVHLG